MGATEVVSGAALPTRDVRKGKKKEERRKGRKEEGKREKERKKDDEGPRPTNRRPMAPFPMTDGP